MTLQLSIEAMYTAATVNLYPHLFLSEDWQLSCIWVVTYMQNWSALFLQIPSAVCCCCQAPNDDSESLGDVKATANQGSAVGGAFTLTNAYGGASQVGSASAGLSARIIG